MDKRSQSFESYQNHPWLGRSFKKLNAEELTFCRQTLAKHAMTSKNDFMAIAVRLFMDVPKKPKHWREIEELLVCANSSLI